MFSYLKITNPITKRKVNINSKLGKKILYNYYINLYGGSDTNENNIECMICLQNIIDYNNVCLHPFDEKRKSHRVHRECIKKWVDTKKAEDLGITCPTCRGDISNIIDMIPPPIENPESLTDRQKELLEKERKANEEMTEAEYEVLKASDVYTVRGRGFLKDKKEKKKIIKEKPSKSNIQDGSED